MRDLDPDKIFGTAPAKRVIGSEGEVHEVVQSTMDLARQRATAGAGDGYVVLAENQESGRGRKGAWKCPAGKGLLLSVVLRIGLRRSQRMLLGFLGAVAAAETLGEFGVPTLVKWPNDIVVDNGGEKLRIRKLGGVLVEQVSRGDAAPMHVLGIGLNINQASDELPARTVVPATSVRVEKAGKEVDRNRVCSRLLSKLNEWYGKLRLGHPDALLARWRNLSCLPGKRVRARVDGRVMEGQVSGLRASGELLFRTSGGQELLLSSERTTLLVGPND